MAKPRNEKVLVCGCGDLAWGHRVSSPFGVSEWELGSLPEPLSPAGGEHSELRPSFTDELDGVSGWSASRLPGEASVSVVSGPARGLEVVPSWETLAGLRAEEMTGMLGGSGVLVTPEAWRESDLGRAFLRAWGEQGWLWASLEEVLRLRFSAGARFVSAGRNWLRIWEPGGIAVVPNGPEAACASALAPKILSKVLTKIGAILGAELTTMWMDTEAPKTEWLIRQQIGNRVAAAYSEGNRWCEIAPFFFFSSSQAQQIFEELAHLWVKIDLPEMPYTSWWDQIASADFMPTPSGAQRRPAFRWGDLETIFVAHPEGANLSPRSEIRSLYDHLRFNGKPHRLVDPAMLKEGLAIGGEIGPVIARCRQVDLPAQAPVPSHGSPTVPQDSGPIVRSATLEPGDREPQPALESEDYAPIAPTDFSAETHEQEPVFVAPDPLLDFRPDSFYIGDGESLEQLVVWIDEIKVPPEQIRNIEMPSRKRGYRLEGVAVSRGAIVRIDFEGSANFGKPS